MARKKPFSSDHFQIQKTSITSIMTYLIAFLGSIALLAAFALLVIFPIWYLAIEHKTAYTIAVLVALGALPAAFFVYRLYRAIRDSRIDDVYAKLLHWLSILFLLVIQVLLALVNILLINLGETVGTLHFATITASLVAGSIAFLSLFFLSRTRSHGILLQIGFVIFSVLLSLHVCYWLAVHIVRQVYPGAVSIIFAIFVFFFSEKLTKIRREKKKTGEKATFH